MDDDRLSLTRSLEIDVYTGFGDPTRSGTLSGSALVEENLGDPSGGYHPSRERLEFTFKLGTARCARRKDRSDPFR